MVTSFELATATRVLFGAGKLAEAPAILAAAGVGRVLLVTGRRTDRAHALGPALAAAGVDAAAVFPVDGEPTLDVARAGVAAALGARCDGVLAIGGGSAVDAGKAIAALAANGGDPLDYLEVIGRGAALAGPSLPFVAVPTTAGTGSEVTRNAVLGAPADGVKASLRSPHMLPRAAIVDPDLLSGLPPPVLASGGLDALSQLIEPLLSSRANPLTDALAREGIRRSARALRPAYERGLAAAPELREDLALASLLGGLCLANAGLGAVHGFAAPAGAMFGAPHGAVCAALLVPVMEVNLRALESRAPEHPSRARFQEIATLVTGDLAADARAGITWVRELVAALGVRGLGAFGMTPADTASLVARARAASSMRGNPVVLTDAELEQIAAAAI